MKKILLSLAVVLCAASVSAQSWVSEATTASKWAAGLRVGPGVQAQAEYSLNDTNYLEARFGMGLCTPYTNAMADFELLYNWRLAEWDWTPNAGTWFLDAGCGVVVGGRENYAYFGVAGQGKFGIKFKAVPIRLAVDWTPFVGPDIFYWKGYTHADFNAWGFANCGLSAVYCF